MPRFISFKFTEEDLHDFYVGVGNTAAADEPPTSSPPSYTVCAFHPGTPAELKTYLYCEDRSLWGRYVTIQIDSDLTTETLALCEVEVYSGKMELQSFMEHFNHASSLVY